MSFLIPCPNCGLRTSQEFRFGGEYHARPAMTASDEEWAHYLYDRQNVAGLQQEWWFHRHGCRKWFLAVRDTRDNTVIETFWPGDAQGEGQGSRVKGQGSGGEGQGLAESEP